MNLLLKGNKHPMPMPPMSNESNSRITGMSNNDGTAAYSYDATDQLTGVDYSYQPDEAYTYDANGNRTNPGYVTGKNNRLLSDGKFNYEYDDEGNVIRQTDILTGEVTAYTWDYRNRLTNVTRNGASVGTYNYDTYDQRIGKTTATGTNRFVYGQNQNIALEFDGSGTLTNRYLHGNSIDAIIADEANGAVGWTLTDNLGTVRDVVDGTGARQNHFVYDSFGNVTNETNPSFDTRFTFTGREFDAETENYYYRNRQLRPSIGRFIEEDPLGFSAGDPNLYRYVKNSPATSVDPSGLAGQILSFKRQFTYRLGFGSRNNLNETDINKIGNSAPNTIVGGVIRGRPIIRTFSPQIQILTDEVKAKIRYVKEKPGSGKRTLHSIYNGLYPGNEQGHIVPDILGGSDKSGVIDPFENNFFSQNFGVNRGAYAYFNKQVHQELEKFTGKKEFDPCNLPPDAKYITYDVRLYYSISRPQQYTNYPLRPSSFDVNVQFHDVTQGEDVSKRLYRAFGNP
jgi:RHS repeat-associated protein